MTDEKPNLYQRIQAVALTVTSVEKTGKTQFNSKATSIGDVENALRGPMFEHGVITRWGYIELTDLSNGKLWCCRLRVTVVNADNPADQFEDEWTDVGTNPMAATSFARKGFLKALFHLTGDEDEAHAPTPETTTRQNGRSNPTPRGAPQLGSGTRLDTETGEIQPMETPSASPYKPASANQLATASKLARLLGYPEESGMEDWTSADASERITKLSHEYNARKGVVR